jgi:hypothetical protein
MPYGASLAGFDAYTVNGQRTFMETCGLRALDSGSIDILIEAMATAVSPGCAIVTHEFRSAASRVPLEAMAFGLRRVHKLVEILAALVDRPDEREEQRHRRARQVRCRGGRSKRIGSIEIPSVRCRFACGVLRFAVV